MQTQRGGEQSNLAEDRRRAHRQQLITRAILYRDDNKASPARVTIRDVSLKGVGFDSPVPIEHNVRCRLHIEAGPARITWRLRVVCCGKMDKAGYHVGGQFLTSELSPEADANSDDLRAFFQ
jgi:hypothetical protein